MNKKQKILIIIFGIFIGIVITSLVLQIDIFGLILVYIDLALEPPKYPIERQTTEINSNDCDFQFHGDSNIGATYFCDTIEFGECLWIDAYLEEPEYKIEV